MTELGEASLFMVTAAAHITLILFALLRLKVAPAVVAEDKVSFQSKPMARMNTLYMAPGQSLKLAILSVVQPLYCKRLMFSLQIFDQPAINVG